MNKKIHLVLGSGGARGIAHIGVIEMLQTEGYDIVSVNGCSMGAVVGGMYCAGYLPEYKKWLLSLTKSSVFGLFDFTITKQGFVKGDKVLGKLKEFTGELDIENFRIPFTAVATDLLHKKEIHFNSGNLYKALRASIAIPGVFTPVAEQNSFMVDGSVLNPLPLNLVDKNAGELIVAVNVNGHVAYKHLPTESEQEKTWLNKFYPFNSKNKKRPVPSFSVFDVLNTSYDFTQDRLTELSIQLYPPDILIEIPRNVCSVFDFYKAAHLIEFGMEAYKTATVKMYNR